MLVHMRLFLSALAPLGAIALLAAPRPAYSQDRFEIEVYPYQTAERGEWELEAHLNHTRRGSTAFDGRVAPTQGQTRLTAELTRGLTDHWEVSAYLLSAHSQDVGAEFAGWRLRSRVRGPETWRLPVQVGMSVELEATQPSFSDSRYTLEVVPILEKRFGQVRLTVNPVLEHDLSGPESAEGWELEPRARFGVPVSRRVTVALEYYGKLGHIGEISPLEAQGHQFYPSVDLKLGDDLAVNLGVGIGTATSGDRLVFKSRFEIPLGGERH